MKLLKCYKMWKNEFSSTRRDKWIEENSVVNTKDGICISLHTCNQILDKIIQRQGLRKISFYELRYSWVSYLNSCGVVPKTISERLGHSDVSITLNFYTHLYDEKKLTV